ncbi:MAG: DMT family transporter [Gammaproteobacteria bacterium]|nr:DMT family transporter [Gammaproteobacteria bacterium]
MIRALMLLILLGVVWGSGYSIARYATTHGVPSIGYSFWQSLGPALVLLILTIGRWRQRLPSLLRYWRYYCVTGVLGIAIPNTNMYILAPHLPAGLMAVIVNTVPLMIYPLALLVRQERFHLGRMVGILLGVIGVMLIVWPGSGIVTFAGDHWVLTALLTPLSFALCVLYINRYRPPQSVDSLVLSAGMLSVSALLLIPVVYSSKQFYTFHSPLHFVDGLVLLEIALSSVGYVLLFKLVDIAGPVYYSLVNGVVALTGLFWGWVVFHEVPSIMTLIALLFILLAIAMVTFYRVVSITKKTPRD